MFVLQNSKFESLNIASDLFRGSDVFDSLLRNKQNYAPLNSMLSNVAYNRYKKEKKGQILGFSIKFQIQITKQRYLNS